MMRVWSHRPQFLHLGLFIAAYILGGGSAHARNVLARNLELGHAKSGDVLDLGHSWPSPV